MSINKLTTEQIQLRWRLDQGAHAALTGLLANPHGGLPARPRSESVFDALTTIIEQAYAASMMLEHARKETHRQLDEVGE